MAGIGRLDSCGEAPKCETCGLPHAMKYIKTHADSTGKHPGMYIVTFEITPRCEHGEMYHQDRLRQGVPANVKGLQTF